MHEKHKLTNLSERCRICLSDYGSMSALFNESLQEKLRDLSKCTSVDIKDEQDLPKIICHVCLYKLELWSEFKEEFLRANEMLTSHVQFGESADNAESAAKRRRSEAQESGEDDPVGNDKKKGRVDSSPKPEETANSEHKKDLKDECVSEERAASPKDTNRKDSCIPNMSSMQKEVKEHSTDNLQSKPPPDPAKVKSLSGKRGKTTERRIASTKRWVERKKALMAATGEDISDTDSIASDDVQLSPIQKARAKTNADKEAEKKKRIARALKNLETYMAGKYAIKHDGDNFVLADTDSDMKMSRSQKTLSSDYTPKKTDNTVKEDGDVKAVTEENGIPLETAKESETAAPTSEKIVNDVAEKNKEAIEVPFTPHLIKTELNVGDATYIISSTLVISEANESNRTLADTRVENAKTVPSDENTQETNTDIIDAVQLRRVHPIPSNASEKKAIERCLNIEVEGTELETLKRVQLDLAGFVEKEMRYRLFRLRNVKKQKGKKGRKKNTSTLNEQLKTIVEKAIKRNFDTSMMNIPFIIPGPGPVTPAFVEMATRSSKFQPKILLHRLNVEEESWRYRIASTSKLVDIEMKDPAPVLPLSRKRKHLPPARYNEYVTSGLDSDSDILREKRSVKVAARNSTNASKQTAKRSQAVVSEGKKKVERTNAMTCEVVECDTTTTSIINNSVEIKDPKTANKTVTTEAKATDAHRCGVCQKSFKVLSELEAHSLTHKVEANQMKQNKQKLMRCKRCHEIVEARLVKQHVCRSTKNAHKCYVCNSTFRTEKLLARHLKSHDQSEFKIDVTKIDPVKAANTSVQQNNASLNAQKAEVQVKVNETKEGEADVACTRKESYYTCFVCNKTFTDEEVLKDHLQKHCDDMSEGEESVGKEQYQCAICGDSMESEDALEEHVEKHLFNDEDDNPNLISISSETERKETSYSCTQCAEVFNSAMLLEMHMQAHEEEAAIAEWERRGLKTCEYQCMICDEPFDTEEDLSEHLDVHNGNVHVCQLCEKPFQTLEDLQNHVATH